MIDEEKKIAALKYAAQRFPDSDYSFTENGFIVKGDVHIGIIKSLPFPFYTVDGSFTIQGKLDTLENFPKEVTENLSVTFLEVGDYTKITKKIGGTLYFSVKIGESLLKFLPLLFIDVKTCRQTVRTTYEANRTSNVMDQYLNKNRVNGKIPREYIPTTINLIRDNEELRLKMPIVY
jgi:hypothetical protein